MAVKKKGLGKGLDSLIPDNRPAKAEPAKAVKTATAAKVFFIISTFIEKRFPRRVSREKLHKLHCLTKCKNVSILSN